MRFIHTADWHLGRQFHNYSLIEDQRQVLEQLVALVRDVEAEAVVIAGDVYDRAVPSPEAVHLLDDFLEATVLGLGVPVIGIAGNHDSGRRLGFGSRLLRKARLYLQGELDPSVRPIGLEDQHGPVHFFALPFAEPASARDRLACEDLHSHSDVLVHVRNMALAQVPDGERSVCIAHCFTAGGEACESERPLSVGGATAVSPASFNGFTYAALGHLHRCQGIGERIRYSGSLLKYSFSEIPHAKSVSLVDIDGEGHVKVSEHPLRPARDLRRIEGEIGDLLKGPAPGENAEDFLLVSLTDRQALLDPMMRLREVYPNVLHIERPALERSSATAPQTGQTGQGDEALFSAFFSEVTGDPLSDEERAAFLAVYEDLRCSEREAQP